MSQIHLNPPPFSIFLCCFFFDAASNRPPAAGDKKHIEIIAIIAAINDSEVGSRVKPKTCGGIALAITIDCAVEAGGKEVRKRRSAVVYSFIRGRPIYRLSSAPKSITRWQPIAGQEKRDVYRGIFFFFDFFLPRGFNNISEADLPSFFLFFSCVLSSKNKISLRFTEFYLSLFGTIDEHVSIRMNGAHVVVYVASVGRLPSFFVCFFWFLFQWFHTTIEEEVFLAITEFYRGLNPSWLRFTEFYLLSFGSIDEHVSIRMNGAHVVVCVASVGRLPSLITAHDRSRFLTLKVGTVSMKKKTRTPNNNNKKKNVIEQQEQNKSWLSSSHERTVVSSHHHHHHPPPANKTISIRNFFHSFFFLSVRKEEEVNVLLAGQSNNRDRNTGWRDPILFLFFFLHKSFFFCCSVTFGGAAALLRLRWFLISMTTRWEEPRPDRNQIKEPPVRYSRFGSFFISKFHSGVDGRWSIFTSKVKTRSPLVLRFSFSFFNVSRIIHWVFLFLDSASFLWRVSSAGDPFKSGLPIGTPFVLIW